MLKVPTLRVNHVKARGEECIALAGNWNEIGASWVIELILINIFLIGCATIIWLLIHGEIYFNRADFGFAMIVGL